MLFYVFAIVVRFVCFIPLQSFKSPLPFLHLSIFIIFIGFSTIFTQQCEMSFLIGIIDDMQV